MSDGDKLGKSGRTKSKAAHAKAEDARQAPENAPTEAGPLILTQDTDTGDRFLVYQGKDGIRVDLRVEGETFWATQAQMAMMFGVTPQNVTMHLKNVFAAGELDEASVCKEALHTGRDGKRYKTKFYELNALISVGYRVGGPMGTMFRIWATDKLFQYLTKGFVLDDRRLKNPDGKPDYFDELLDRIRDIRSSEKRMWMRVLELASFCADYNADDPDQHQKFFAEFQNTMHWAHAQKTAAEIVISEVSATKPNAGVIHFDGRQPTVAEASIAKNLLGEMAITALNQITTLALEFFESQAEQRRPTTLSEFLEKLRQLIKLDGRPVKPAGHLGGVTAKEARAHASKELSEWKAAQRSLKEREGEKALQQISAAAKARKPKGNKGE